MTVVPLPASPCVRCSLGYNQSDGFDGGSRLYLSYSGSAPSAANCTTLATDIATAWNNNMSPFWNDDWTFVEVDVLDIATDSGLSGQWTGSHVGTYAGVALPSQCSTNIEYNIARRYRGGKPRMYMPPPAVGALNTPGTWSSTFVTNVNAAMANAISVIEALSVGSMGTLAHVNLSYYKGFTNITNSSGRERAVPTYRSAALLDTVEGYSTNFLVGSQRRRRNATTL